MKPAPTGSGVCANTIGTVRVAPRVTRAAVLRDAADAAGIGQWAAIQSMAPSLGVEVILVGLRDAGEIDRAITAFARGSNGGLIVTGSAPAAVHRLLYLSGSCSNLIGNRFRAQTPETTARLFVICEAKFGMLFRYEGGAFHAAASLGVPPAYADYLRGRAHVVSEHPHNLRCPCGYFKLAGRP